MREDGLFAVIREFPNPGVEIEIPINSVRNTVVEGCGVFVAIVVHMDVQSQLFR